MRKILTFRINKRIMPVFTTLLLLVALVPVYRLALYATPFYDDFNYAISVRYDWQKGAGFFGVIKSALDVVEATYNTWQGTYGSIFLMALMPGSFGIEFYHFGIWAIITSITIGVFTFAYTLLRRLANASVTDGIVAAELITTAVIEFYHSAQQWIYWYNGAVHYTFAHGLLLILLALCICCVTAKNAAEKYVSLVFAVLFSVYVAGTNFVSALQGILSIGLILFVGLLYKKKDSLIVIIPMIVYLVGIIVSVSAPGNARRQILYEGVARPPIEAILLSFKSGFLNLGRFTGWGVITFVLALLPVFWDILSEFKFEFKFPAIVTILSFCLYATGFTPSWYGMGEEGLARTLCVVKTTFLILLFINEFYWVGWIKCKFRLEEKRLGHFALFYLVTILLFFGAFALENDKAGSFMTYGSYYYVHTGEALNYYNEQLQRIETINNSDNSIVELDPLVWKPWFLCKKNELDTNPEAEQNQAAARWYGKTAIYVVE